MIRGRSVDRTVTAAAALHADARITMQCAEMETSRRAARGLAKVLPMPVRRSKRGCSA
jgi:hypothetical protein